jgi:hypothetical protein
MFEQARETLVESEDKVKQAKPKEVLTYTTSELLRKEILTKSEANWLTGIPRATWDRYARLHEAGHPDFVDFPDTCKPSGKRMGRCKYKTVQVVAWINGWGRRANLASC